MSVSLVAGLVCAIGLLAVAAFLYFQLGPKKRRWHAAYRALADAHGLTYLDRHYHDVPPDLLDGRFGLFATAPPAQTTIAFPLSGIRGRFAFAKADVHVMYLNATGFSTTCAFVPTPADRGWLWVHHLSTNIAHVGRTMPDDLIVSGSGWGGRYRVASDDAAWARAALTPALRGALERSEFRSSFQLSDGRLLGYASRVLPPERVLAFVDEAVAIAGHLATSSPPTAVTSASFPCSVHGTLAATASLVPAQQAMDLAWDRPGSGSVETTAYPRLVLQGAFRAAYVLTRTADVRAAITAARPEALYDLDPKYAPFYCVSCRAVYCRDDWAFEPFRPSEIYLCTDADCPAGHKRTFDDEPNL